MSAFFWRHPTESDLALFAGGELGPLGRWRIEGHLNGCERCRQQVAEFFEVRSQVMDLAELPPLDWAAMTQGIQLRLEREREKPQPWLGWRPAWGAVAAVALLAVAGFWVMRPSPGAVWLDASANAVELRVGGQPVMTLVSGAKDETPVHWRVSAGAVSARYLDADTGQITVNQVYAE